jgi:hypothetical protein
MSEINKKFKNKLIVKDNVHYSLEDTLVLSYNRNVLKQKKHSYHKENNEFDKSKFSRKYKEQYRINKLTGIFNDKCLTKKYSLPSKLVERITEIIQLEYFNYFNSTNKSKYNVYKRKLAYALYICIAIHHFNKQKYDTIKNIGKVTSDIHYKYDVELGCELSKNILTKIITNKNLYEIKNILYKYNIIRKCSII